MANMSDMQGKVLFPQEFWNKYKQLLTENFGTYHGDYDWCFCGGCDPEAVQSLDYDGYVELEIYGSGRWSFWGNLEQFWNYGDEDMRKVFLDENPTLIFDYDDYECGDVMLCHQRASVTFVKDEDGYVESYNNKRVNFVLKPVVSDLGCEDYSYSDLMKIELGFEDGYVVGSFAEGDISELSEAMNAAGYHIDHFFDKFCEYLEKDKNRNGAITVPNYEWYCDVPDELYDEMKECDVIA